MRPEAIHALRTGVAISTRPASLLRIRGEQAFDLLDAVSPRPLFLRDGQALHTLFLDEHAHPFADVYIVCDDLDYLVLAEGPTSQALVDWLWRHAGTGIDAEILDLGRTHTLVSLDGPYAWECLGRVVGPEVVGVPYMGLFFLPAFEGLGLRAGKTGEYGYDLVLPNAAVGAFREALPVDEFAVVEAEVDVLDLCALENGFFSVRTPGASRLTPMELQLQWRLDRRRAFPGRDAFEAAREAAGPRITWFRGPPGSEPPLSGEVLSLDGQPVGQVLVARHSLMLDAPFGVGLLARNVAFPGLRLDRGEARLRTVSCPLLHNRSLFVNAQRHGWASRGVDVFPPIAPAWK